MKALIMRLIVKLFGVDYIRGWMYGATPIETSLDAAMEILRHDRVLLSTPSNKYRHFSRFMTTGVSSDAVYNQFVRNHAINTSTISEVIRLTILALIRPYTPQTVDDIEVIITFITRKTVTMNGHRTLLGYQKIFSDELINHFPNLPLHHAKTIACMVFHILSKGEQNV